MVNWLHIILIVTNLVTISGLYFVTRRMLKLRRQRRRSFVFSPYPINQVKLEHIDPCFARGRHGISPASTVKFIGGEGVMASLSDRETWVIAGLAKSANKIFEFGTCSGKTSHIMALNAPNNATVYTLTIHPNDVVELEFNSADDRYHQHKAIEEAAFDNFYYEGQETESKIQQIFCDSKRFDERPFSEKIDLVFIDGAHTWSYVENDTNKALEMVTEGGVILWHDYKVEAPDVFGFLNKLSKTFINCSS